MSVINLSDLVPKNYLTGEVGQIIDDNGTLKVQPLSFIEQNPSSNGNPEEFVLKSFNITGNEPSYNSNNAMDFYKCATVDTVNQIWTGYKAVLSGGKYEYESTITTGLTYGSYYTPNVNGIYNNGCSVIFKSIWGGVPEPLFSLPLNGNLTGTLNGNSVICTSEGSVTFGSAQGISDGTQAAIFDGGMITTPVSANFWGNDATIFFRVYQTASGRNGFFINIGGFVCAIDTNGGVYSIWAGDGTAWNNIEADTAYGQSSQSVILNNWVNIAYVHNATSELYSLYINGQKVLEKAPMSGTDYPVSVSDQNVLVIGKWSQWGYNFYGQLRDFRIYQSALSESEITALAFEFTPTQS